MQAQHVKKSVPILIADDDADDFLLAKETLETFGFNNDIHWVRDGAELKDYLLRRGEFDKRDSPDPGLLILDLKMPKINGLEFLADFQPSSKLFAIPIVVLTTSSAAEDKVRSYRLGAVYCMKKPINLDKCIEMLSALRHQSLEIIELSDRKLEIIHG